MNYFLCTYGDFPEKDEMVERSLKEKVYLLHQYARYPSAIDNVDSGDVLLLNQIGHGVVAFAISAGRVSHRDEADEWNYVLTTRDGWHKGKNAQYSAYGISWATLQGGLLGDSEETYDYSKFSCGEMINHKEAFIQTLRRFSHLYRFWFERLGIGSIIPETTKRKDLFERLEKEFDGEEYFTWIPGSNEQERKLDNKPFPFSMVDWISCPWMSFGKCVGKYFVAYGDDGLNTSTVGICKLPEEVEVNKDRHVLFSKFTIPEFTIPTGDKYWYVVKKFNERPCVTEIRNDMQKLIDFLQNAEE